MHCSLEATVFNKELKFYNKVTEGSSTSAKWITPKFVLAIGLTYNFSGDTGKGETSLPIAHFVL